MMLLLMMVLLLLLLLLTPASSAVYLFVTRCVSPPSARLAGGSTPSPADPRHRTAAGLPASPRASATEVHIRIPAVNS